MASLKDILAAEQQRSNDKECRRIRLFHEGSFYRAYERSAWLINTYVGQLKPTRRNVKGMDESIVFCGFPITSLAKYTPEGCDSTIMEDKSVVVSLPETLYPAIPSPEEEQKRFTDWKQSVPLTESKKDEHKESIINVARAPIRMTEIMQKILAYPLEQKSPIETMNFVSEIKQEISQLF